MEHVAIDLGSRKSQICVRGEDGRIVDERRCETAELKRYLATRPPSRVVVETCAEAFGVADAARELGHETRVVPATLVKTLGVGARRLKTDQRDARALSEVSCRVDLPTVHVPRRESRDRKSMCGMREALVGARMKLINTVRGWLRGQGRRLGTASRTTFTKRVRALCEGQPPSYVERQLQAIEMLTAQICEADDEVQCWAAADETCQRLMTVPAVGALTSLRFVAALDDASRFEGPHQVESYLGLVPGENSSSERQQKLSITKAGPRALRWVLIQAAWVLRTRCRRAEAVPLQLWAARVEQRRGKRAATVALARKLAGILFAIWRDGSVYDGSRGAKMI
ncbi:MAG TPA: IS110 family transposase [Polyangia bacterium]|nr:IS110 family transposase [Polyangia bacterium]